MKFASPETCPAATIEFASNSHVTSFDRTGNWEARDYNSPVYTKRT